MIKSRSPFYTSTYFRNFGFGQGFPLSFSSVCARACTCTSSWRSMCFQVDWRNSNLSLSAAASVCCHTSFAGAMLPGTKGMYGAGPYSGVIVVAARPAARWASQTASQSCSWASVDACSNRVLPGGGTPSWAASTVPTLA